jgi:hypothetical protein
LRKRRAQGANTPAGARSITSGVEPDTRSLALRWRGERSNLRSLVRSLDLSVDRRPHAGRYLIKSIVAEKQAEVASCDPAERLQGLQFGVAWSVSVHKVGGNESH